MKAHLIKKGLVHVSLKLLERYPAKQTPLKDISLNGVKFKQLFVAKWVDNSKGSEAGMKSHLMKIIANLSYKSLECQEIIRNEGTRC